MDDNDEIDVVIEQTGGYYWFLERFAWFSVSYLHNNMKVFFILIDFIQYIEIF